MAASEAPRAAARPSSRRGEEGEPRTGTVVASGVPQVEPEVAARPLAGEVPHHPHRLGLRISSLVGAAALGLLLAARLALGTPPAWLGVVLAVLIGASAYASVWWLVAERLQRARYVMEHIRALDFRPLDDPLLEGPDDELGDVLREGREAGHVLESEIARLRKMENYRRAYLGNVSHELKTPIFSVMGFAETLLGGALEDERVRRSFVQKIQRNAERLDHLVRDLTKISRLETGELDLEVAPFCLARLASEVVESLEPQAAQRRITVRTQISAALPLVRADRERIRQVLTNLVENAVKYNRDGGTVEVVARVVTGRSLPSPQEVKVSVVDDGIGIAPEHLPRLTERFFRVDTSRSRAQGGTGLGLAIVKHTLAGHQRTLRIDSVPGRGSTFSFMLPVAASAPVEEGEA